MVKKLFDNFGKILILLGIISAVYSQNIGNYFIGSGKEFQIIKTILSIIQIEFEMILQLIWAMIKMVLTLWWIVFGKRRRSSTVVPKQDDPYERNSVVKSWYWAGFFVLNTKLIWHYCQKILPKNLGERAV